MLRLAFAAGCFLVVLGRAGAETPGDFSGEWKSTFGIVSIDQKNGEAKGVFAPGKFPFKGKVSGKTFTFEYDEGQVKGDASFELADDGRSYSGKFQIRGGRGGVWNGWRPDPEAVKRSAEGDFDGFWLTNLGLMKLEQNGGKVKGKYALRGGSTIEGSITGGRLDFSYKAFFPGTGWFDLSKDGKSISGAADTTGAIEWYSFNGRKAPEFVNQSPLQPGKMVQGSTSNLLTYVVRAPEGFDPKAKKLWPAIVLLHGSNMNAQSYVNTMAAAWPQIATRYIIIGINGERPVDPKADELAFNFTYVNFMGKSTYQGFPGTDKESPALVRDALEELKKVYPIDHYFVGGHSQGGFLTYFFLMHFPELVSGVFPISCGLVMQCEPEVFQDEALRAAQRRVPLAIVHAQNDPIVPFSMSSYAYDEFVSAGWPKVRLFTDNASAHMFARLPVDKALGWLEIMTSEDPAALIAFAEQSVKGGSFHDAISALNTARGLKPDAKLAKKLDSVSGSIDKKVKPLVPALLKGVQSGAGGDWVEQYLKFKDEFGQAPSAAKLVKAFDALGAKQEKAGKEAFNQAQALFQQGKRDEAFGKLEDIVKSAYASSSYRTAKKWLAERK